MPSTTEPQGMDHAEPTRRLVAVPSLRAPQPNQDWAVAAIHADGTLGPAIVVTASSPVAATAVSRAATDSRTTPTGPTSALDTRLGLVQAAEGRHGEAERSLARGFQGVRHTSDAASAAGFLALVEAFRGEVDRASEHADVALSGEGRSDDAGTRHARLARAWVHLERGGLDECGECLDLLEAPVDGDADPWLWVAHLLLESRWLTVTHRPELAARLLTDLPAAGWAREILTVARADAFLAEGEPRRALATLTPLPDRAVVEASVTTAAGRRAVGDTRGARAVLNDVVCELERAPLTLQVRAWLLESRLSEDRGQRDRTTLLLDRALRTAQAAGVRASLIPDLRWIRARVDGDPDLRRAHREYLVEWPGPGNENWDGHGSAHARVSASRATSGDHLGAPLTERESQVLDLLAQMCSTEEIGRELHLSTNTVKTHLKSLFGKLCVHRRVDAVRRGRQLGLC